jgi:four helix bundle protein
MKTDLLNRTFLFATRILKLVEALPATKSGHIVGGQLGRAGTSVAANYRAAQRARSRREFIAKMGTVEEEADESVFWLEIVISTSLIPVASVAPLLKESKELTAIAVAILKKAKANEER